MSFCLTDTGLCGAIRIIALEFLSEIKKGSRKRRGAKCPRGDTQSCGELFSVVLYRLKEKFQKNNYIQLAWGSREGHTNNFPKIQAARHSHLKISNSVILKVNGSSENSLYQSLVSCKIFCRWSLAMIKIKLNINYRNQILYILFNLLNLSKLRICFPFLNCKHVFFV